GRVPPSTPELGQVALDGIGAGAERIDPGVPGPVLPGRDVPPVGGQGVARSPLLHGQPGQVLLSTGRQGLVHGTSDAGPPCSRRRPRPTPRMVDASMISPS